MKSHLKNRYLFTNYKHIATSSVSYNNSFFLTVIFFSLLFPAFMPLLVGASVFDMTPAIDMHKELSANKGYFKIDNPNPTANMVCIRHDHMSPLGKIMKHLSKSDEHSVSAIYLEGDPEVWKMTAKQLGLKYFPDAKKIGWEIDDFQIQDNCDQKENSLDGAVQNFQNNHNKKNARKLLKRVDDFKKGCVLARDIGLTKAMKKAPPGSILIYGGAHAGSGEYDSIRKHEKPCAVVYAPKYIRDLVGKNSLELDLLLKTMLTANDIKKLNKFTTKPPKHPEF